MAAHNSEQRPEDPPYPWSLLPMARAVIAVVQDETHAEQAS